MRHIIQLFLVLGLSFASIVVQAEKVKQLKMGTSQEVSTLNPITASMLATIYVNGATVRGLNVIDENNKWVPQLAKSIPSIENGQAKIIGKGKNRHIVSNWIIRDNAQWGDGTPVTGHDVKFSWQVALHPKVAVTTHQIYDQVKEIIVDKKNPKKFSMIHKAANWNFSRIGDFSVVPKHLEGPIFSKHKENPDGYANNSLYAKDPTNPGLYNGPFVVTEFKHGSHITLKKNPKFFGSPAKIDEVIIKLIPNTATLESNLRSGTIDMINLIGISFDQALSFDKKAKSQGLDFITHFVPSQTYEHIELNSDKNPVLKDKKVRQALIYSIDREALTQSLFEGKQPTALHFFAPVDPWFSDNPKKIRKYTYNPKKASQLLASAGWKKGKDGYLYKDGKKLSIQMMSTAGNKVRELVQVFMQNQYKQVGIELTIKNEPARVFFGETTKKRKFEGMAMFAWTTLPEEDLRPFFHSQSIPKKENGYSGSNYAGWSSPKLDNMIAEIEVEFDANKRKRIAEDMMAFYTEEVRSIPLYYRANVSITPKKLSGYKMVTHKYPSTYHIEKWELK